MAKHLPPPKNKHLSQSSHKAKKEHIISAKDRDLLSERQFSFKTFIACLISLVMLVGLRYIHLEGWVNVALYALPLLAVSAGVIIRLLTMLSERDYYDEDIIMLAVAVAAFAIGHYVAASISMLLYRLGETFTNLAVSICRKNMDELVSSGTRKANVLKNGRVFSVRPEQLVPGDILIVSPGETVPLDGVVVEGMSAIDSSLISGDKTPFNITTGSKVLSGCRNLSRDLKIQVTRGYDKSAYARIIDGLMDTNRKKAKQEIYSSRFLRYFTPAAVLLAVLLSVIPPIFYGDWATWIERGIVILIMACPCALSVSVPLCYMSGLIKSTKNGIQVENADVLENLSRTETMVFDKTGIITDGKYTVAAVFPEKGVSTKQLLQVAAEAERYSKHPVAKALRQVGELSSLEEGETIETEELHGKGVSSYVRKHHIYVGNASLMEEHGIHYKVPQRAGAAIHVAVDEIYWGYILVNDKLKNGAFDAIESMRLQGVRNMVLLTGDVRSVSRTLASSLNFDMVKAELMPEGKVAAVEYLMATKGDRSSLGFVGDAENDREAILRANIGIAVGAIDAENPFDTADVVIMSKDLAKLPKMMEISRLSTNAARLNILATVAVKFALIILGAFGIIPISLAAGCEAGVTIFSMLNTMRILKPEKKVREDE